MFATMEEDESSVTTRVTMKLAAGKQEDDYGYKKKVNEWLVDQ